MAEAKKSVIRNLEQDEVLFESGQDAFSLFIVQKGQIRLYGPKGRGQTEVGVLRKGEILGEMAYFKEEGEEDSPGKRSCSAEAIVPSELVEISFAAFDRMVKGINPWLRTIFNALIDRLRKANRTIKSLEGNNVSYGVRGKGAGHRFFMSNDIIRSLGVLYLVIKAHGKKHANGHSIQMRPLIFYAQKIFNIAEVKFTRMCYILKGLGWCFFIDNENKDPDVIVVNNVDMLREFMLFFNAQKLLVEEKEVRISSRCELFLDRVLKKINEQGMVGDNVKVAIGDILEDFKKKKLEIDVEDLGDAKKHGLVGDVMVENEILCLSVKLNMLNKIFPAIKLKNAIEKCNEGKSSDRYGT